MFDEAPFEGRSSLLWLNVHITMVQKKDSNPWKIHGKQTALTISQKLHVYLCFFWDPHLVFFFQLQRYNLQMICRWNEPLYDLGTMLFFYAMLKFRVNWTSPWVSTERSAWNRSCLYLKTLGHVIRLLTTTTMMTGKRKRCLKWLVGNCHPISELKSTQNLLKKCLS